MIMSDIRSRPRGLRWDIEILGVRNSGLVPDYLLSYLMIWEKYLRLWGRDYNLYYRNQTLRSHIINFCNSFVGRLAKHCTNYENPLTKLYFSSKCLYNYLLRSHTTTQNKLSNIRVTNCRETKETSDRMRHGIIRGIVQANRRFLLSNLMHRNKKISV